MKEIILILFVAVIVGSCSIHYARIADDMTENWIRQQISRGR